MSKKIDETKSVKICFGTGSVGKRGGAQVPSSGGDHARGRRLLLLRLHHAIQGPDVVDRDVADGGLRLRQHGDLLQPGESPTWLLQHAYLLRTQI